MTAPAGIQHYSTWGWSVNAEQRAAADADVRPRHNVIGAERLRLREPRPSARRERMRVR